MFKFLFVIFFFFILLVFLMGFSILRTFKNIFFGSGNSTRKGEQRRQTNSNTSGPVSYTHLRAHETGRNLVCRLLLEKKKNTKQFD